MIPGRDPTGIGRIGRPPERRWPPRDDSGEATPTGPAASTSRPIAGGRPLVRIGEREREGDRVEAPAVRSSGPRMVRAATAVTDAIMYSLRRRAPPSTGGSRVDGGSRPGA